MRGGSSGEQLHDERGQELLSKAVGDTGAIIVGRRTYDDSIRRCAIASETGSRDQESGIGCGRP